MTARLAIPMFLLGSCLGLGFAIGMSRVSEAVAKFNKPEIIRSKGYAERVFRSDRAVWRLSVTVRQRELPDAQRLMESQSKEVKAHLLANGARADMLDESPPDVVSVMRRNDKGVETNEIEHYRIVQYFFLSSNDVELVARLSTSVGALLEKGIEARGEPPKFFCTELETHKKQLLADATRNARERAEILASNAGGKVGRLVDASQGVFQITRPDSTDFSDYGAFDTTSITKVAKVVVTLEFAVEKP